MLVRFFKAGVLLQGGAQEKVVLAKVLHGLQGLAADYGIDTAHLVADFPTGFKQGDLGRVEIHDSSFTRQRCAMFFRSKWGCSTSGAARQGLVTGLPLRRPLALAASAPGAGLSCPALARADRARDALARAAASRRISKSASTFM